MAPDAPIFPAPINLLALSVLVPPLWRVIMDLRGECVVSQLAPRSKAYKTQILGGSGQY